MYFRGDVFFVCVWNAIFLRSWKLYVYGWLKRSLILGGEPDDCSENQHVLSGRRSVLSLPGELLLMWRLTPSIGKLKCKRVVWSQHFCMLFPKTSKNQGWIDWLGLIQGELNNYHLTRASSEHKFNKGGLGRLLCSFPQASQIPSFHCWLNLFPKYFPAKLIRNSVYLPGGQVYMFVFLTVWSICGWCHLLPLSDVTAFCPLLVCVAYRGVTLSLFPMNQMFTVFILDCSTCLVWRLVVSQ